MEIRASFAGRKIRRFTEDENVAHELGRQLVEQIVDQGVRSLETDGLTTRKAVEWFLPRLAKTSPKHQRQAARVLGLLCDSVGGKILKFVTPEEVESVVLLPAASATQAGYFAQLHGFFQACEDFGKLERNPMRALRKPRAKPRRNILTSTQMRAVLDLREEMPAWLFASIILGGFLGIRTVELLRMNWEDIDIEAEQVHIREDVAKQTQSDEYDDRIIDFEPQVSRRKEWLRGTGKLVPVNEDAFYDARGRLVKRLGWKNWPDNSLRHSAATYKLAECKNPAIVANMLGHKSSIRLVMKTYTVPAKKADWKAWIAL